MREGSIVLLHLVSPAEKYWGRIDALGAHGVTLRGLNLQSFDDWMFELGSGEPPAVSPATIFFPLRRVECIFLDERLGPVESYSERFEARVGISADDALRADPSSAPPGAAED